MEISRSQGSPLQVQDLILRLFLGTQRDAAGVGTEHLPTCLHDREGLWVCHPSPSSCELSGGFVGADGVHGAPLPAVPSSQLPPEVAKPKSSFC